MYAALPRSSLCHFDQSAHRARRGEISELPLSVALLRDLSTSLKMTMVAMDKGKIFHYNYSLFTIHYSFIISATPNPYTPTPNP